MLLYPHDPHSQGARALSKTLGVARIRHERSRFIGSPDKLVINWGARELPEQVALCGVLNSPDRVGLASNKLSYLKLLQTARVPSPEFTTDIDVAIKWIRDGGVAVCRTILNGSGGRGIVIADTEDQVVRAPLYTKYIKKVDEYRVHVGTMTTVYSEVPFYEIIDVQKKARRLDSEILDWRIRNLANGFIYKRNDVRAPDHVLENAKLALEVSGLNFGAIDIIVNAKENKSYVLEINTAPGLEGTTLISYRNFFRKFV